jgi:4'-phosphopantetheinyl transferase
VSTIVPRTWPAAELPELRPGEAHVWSVALEHDDADVLSDAERERAARFVHERDTRLWSRARGGLRRILAAYTGADPAALAIEPAACVHCGELHGKPYLAGPDHDGWLRFNLSHSGGLVVIAVANGREVGVDVEATRDGRRLDGIAQRWFSPAEVQELRGLPDAERQAAFYRLWSRKEAYLKATAEGMSGTLAAFDALRLEPPGGAAGWQFADLDVGEGHAGALAVAPAGFRPGDAATGPAGGGRRSR